MLSVVIETYNDEERLARTLASLVGGSVEGIVREVIVYDRGSTDHTAVVAEHAGCVLVADGDLSSALRRAKGDWLLLLEPGARLLDGWTDAAVHHAAATDMPARFSRSKIGRPGLLARLFETARPLSQGLLIGRRQAVASAKAGIGVEALARGRASKRLAAEIVTAPKRGASA